MTAFPIKERRQKRPVIEQLTTLEKDIAESLRTGRPFSEARQQAVFNLTSTSDLERASAAITELRDRAKTDYLARCTAAAKDDLSAFAEVMNFDEPPADHHLFLCDRLMEMERLECLRMSISAPPGHAKPLPYDTKVKAEPAGAIYEGAGGRKLRSGPRLTQLGDLKVGDKVFTHRGRYKRVTAIHEQGRLDSVVIITASGRQIRSGLEHSFLTRRGWIEAQHLIPGDVLASAAYDEFNPATDDWFEFDRCVYKADPVMTVSGSSPTDMMCLTVEDDHTFVAEGVVVHNSTYASHLFGAWYMGRNPTHQYLQSGNSSTFVEKQISSRVRAYIKRPEYQQVFGEAAKLSHTSHSLQQWKLSNERGTYNARGAGSAIAGFRAHFANVDDPIGSREDANSPTIRKKLWDWFIDDFHSRLLPYRPIVIVATRWHEDDIIGRLSQQDTTNERLRWNFVNLPAIAEEDDPLGRAIGDALWPEFYDLDYLLEVKAKSAGSAWNSLYQGHPIDAEGGVLCLDDLSRYDTLPDKENIRQISVSVDTANKDTQRSDYTAIAVFIETKDKKHYLADMIRKRLEFTDLVKTVNQIARRWEAHQIIVEDKGAGTQYIQTQGGFDGRARQAPAPVVPVNPGRNSKEFRFDGVSPMIKSGEVLFPEKGPWIADLEAEIIAFPASTYDDQVDAISQYLDLKRVNVNRGTKKANKRKSAKNEIEELIEKQRRGELKTNLIGGFVDTSMIGHNGGPPLEEQATP